MTRILEFLRRLFRAIGFLTLVYTLGIALGFLFVLLRAGGRIRIIGKMPRTWRSGLLVTSNHPSLLEPIILIFLMFPRFLWNPWKYAPWNTPDRKNFLDPWYLRSWLRFARMIPVDRGNGTPAKNGSKAFFEIVEKLRRKEIVILFPEGGRTAKGQEYHRCNGFKIREPKKRVERSIDLILKRTKCTALPVWLDGFETVLPIGRSVPQFHKSVLTIKIGKPTSELTTSQLIRELLALANAE